MVGLRCGTDTRTRTQGERVRGRERDTHTETGAAIQRQKADVSRHWYDGRRHVRIVGAQSAQRYQTDTARVHWDNDNNDNDDGSRGRTGWLGRHVTQCRSTTSQPPIDSSDGWTRTSANCWTAVERRRCSRATSRGWFPHRKRASALITKHGIAMRWKRMHVTYRSQYKTHSR